MAEDIKILKRDFWARQGAAEVYEGEISSESGINQIKNTVEIGMVSMYAKGAILEVGTGTGRFAIPLAKDPSNSVVAFDYSVDMLTLNRSLASMRQVKGIKYVRGDVDHLPFPSNHFDSVVSITVVRHFRAWQRVLQEYIRVLKPGGALVFEMCSGDHINLANQFQPRFGVRYSRDGYLSYEAEVPFDELRGWLDGQGIDVVERRTYDFLNSNLLLQIATRTASGFARALAGIDLLLTWRPLRHFVAWTELRLLHRLHPMFSCNYFVVGRKR